MKPARYNVKDEKKIRVIIDTDANCEGDDQFALVHAFMCPKIEVVAVISEHYGQDRDQDSMVKSYEEIKKVLKLIKLDQVRVLKGSEGGLNDKEIPLESEASHFIIEECQKEDNRPLYIINQGALTNLASAYLLDSSIGKQIVCISTGGCSYPQGGFEFNYMNDLLAADIIMSSSIPVWQVPEETYSTMQVGFYELWEKVYPCGEIGKYLVENLMHVNSEMVCAVPWFPWMSKYEYSLAFPNGESWSLGDSCGIGILISANAGHYIEEEAPEILPDGSYHLNGNNKKVRIYTTINSRFILEDFFSKLKYYFGS
jgi:hypothetical protein